MWFPVGPAGVPVSMHHRRIGSSTVPGLYFYVPVQSSFKQTLLQSSFSSAAALRFRAPQPPTWVSRPPPDITAMLPICTTFHGGAGAQTGVHNRSRASASQLASLFHLAAEFRTICSFRGLSSSRSLRSSSDRLRPCRSAHARSPANRLPRTRASTPTSSSTRSRSPPVRCLAYPAVCAPLRVSVLPQVHLAPAKPVTCLRTLVPLRS
jgi:hypothetical protein